MAEQTIRLPQEGEKLGSGILISLISTGGSAYVYKIWVESLELYRAVKVMSPDAESDIRDRFQTEARINSKLIHANIVHCYNYGLTAGDLPYIEMEYISGPSLAAVISKRGGGLPPSAALSIALGILEALTYAHTVKYTLYEKQHIGILHRDLKPANIIINSDGIPKLMDYGIARPVDFSIHTVAGTVPGTVAYMSPEACAGGNLDFRSDIFQVGLCLYEMLSGSPAFPQTDLTSLLAAKAEGKIQPLETLVRGLPLPLLAFIRKCIALNPADRFESAQACLTELRTLLTPVEIASSTDIIQAYLENRKPASVEKAVLANKSRIRFAVSIAASLLIIAGAIAFFLKSSAFRSSQEPARATLPAIPPALPAQSPNVGEGAIPNAAPAKVQKPSSAVSAAVSHPTRSPTAQPTKTPANGPASVIPANSNQAPAPDDAAFYIDQGKTFYGSGSFSEALSSFQQALKTPSKQPRQEILKASIYWSAKCNHALYKLSKLPASNYTASWRSVLNLFPAGTPEHSEAQLNLTENSK